MSHRPECVRRQESMVGRLYPTGVIKETSHRYQGSDCADAGQQTGFHGERNLSSKSVPFCSARRADINIQVC